MSKSKYTMKSGDLCIEPTDDDNIWESDWAIYLLQPERIQIGTVTMEGEKANGTVPIKLEIPDKFYRNKGYGTWALKMMREWIFCHVDIYEITATCDHENSACIAALEKAGFVQRYADKFTEVYSITKPKTAWLGLYLIIGIIAGAFLGVLLEFPWVGLGLGLFAGIVVGSYMDAQERKIRVKYTGKKK